MTSGGRIHPVARQGAAGQSPSQNSGQSWKSRIVHPLVSSDTPSWCALTAVAPTVRFNALEILATPTFFFASDFNSRTSLGVHARLTDFFFLAMTAPLFWERACTTPKKISNATAIATG
jgi:hypothetical protein